MPTEPSQDAVEALAEMLNTHLNPPELGQPPEEMAWETLIAEGNPCVDAIRDKARRYLQAALPIERNRWEQEVRERLLEKSRDLATRAAGCRDTAEFDLAVPLEAEAKVLRETADLIFGETERENFALDLALEMQAPIELDQGAVPPLGEAEPVEDCGRCDNTGWLCAECKEPRHKCTCGVDGASENGCPGCQRR